MTQQYSSMPMIAEEEGIPIQNLRYAIQTRFIKPALNIDGKPLYSREQLPAIRAAIKNVRKHGNAA